MNNKDNSNSGQNKPDRVEQNAFLVRLLIVGLSVFAGLGVIAKYHVNADSYKTRFLIESSLSLLVLAVIVFQAYIYRNQWKVMQEQRDKMEAQLSVMLAQAETMVDSLKSTKDLVEQNERSTKAAVESVKIAGESAINSQRAYVSVTGGRVGENRFVVNVENSGNTPAHHVGVRFVIKGLYVPPEMPAVFDVRNFVYIGLLAPHSSKEITLSPYPAWTQDDWVQVNELTDFYVWCRGTIEYYDIFGFEQWDARYTPFCYQRWNGSKGLHPYNTGRDKAT